MSAHHPNTTDGTRSWVSRFNLSQWALDHQAFTRYLMIVLMLLGVAAYFQLGQDEDPPFTFRAMVVRAYWPGATAEQVAEQVADRIEKTLQEVPYADKIRSYSKPGETLVIFQLKDSSPAKEVPQSWYTARKKIGDMQATLPQGVVGPFFNDDFGDVYGVIYALESDGFDYAELKTLADDVRQKLAPQGAELIGDWYGRGAERGIAIVFSITGMLGVLATIAAFRSQSYRLISAAYATDTPLQENTAAS